MAKPNLAGIKAVQRDAAEKAGKSAKAKAAAAQAVGRDSLTGQFAFRVGAVMGAAERSGLIAAKDGRIGGRISQKLVEAAKARTGIETDTDLLEFALANLALEDNFANAFRAVRGTVDPELDLRF